MYIPAFSIRNSVKFLFENCIGGKPGKKNLFSVSGMDFKISRWIRCAPPSENRSKKKNKSAGGFFSKQCQRIKEDQGRQISDPEKYPKEFYFRDIMHDYYGMSLLTGARKYIHKQIIEQYRMPDPFHYGSDKLTPAIVIAIAEGTHAGNHCRRCHGPHY